MSRSGIPISTTFHLELPQASVPFHGMADKGGAYGAKAADTDFRKKWDKEEYAEKARKRDQEEKDRMQENEERLKQGMSLSR